MTSIIRSDIMGGKQISECPGGVEGAPRRGATTIKELSRMPYFTALSPSLSIQLSPVAQFAECDCHEKAIRAKTYVNGVTHFVLQCQTCGRNHGAVPKSVVRVPHSTPPFNEALRDNWQNKRNEWYDERRREGALERERVTAEWWHKYDRYLLTAEWRDKRDRVLERDKERCQARMQGCHSRALNAHHLTYRHVFDEPLFDLVSVCINCHNKLTKADRARGWLL